MKGWDGTRGKSFPARFDQNWSWDLALAEVWWVITKSIMIPFSLSGQLKRFIELRGMQKHSSFTVGPEPFRRIKIEWTLPEISLPVRKWSLSHSNINPMPLLVFLSNDTLSCPLDCSLFNFDFLLRGFQKGGRILIRDSAHPLSLLLS